MGREEKARWCRITQSAVQRVVVVLRVIHHARASGDHYEKAG